MFGVGWAIIFKKIVFCVKENAFSFLTTFRFLIGGDDGFMLQVAIMA